MSRSFWTIIGALAGLYVGTIAFAALGKWLSHSPDDGLLSVVGLAMGPPAGAVLAWFLAGLRRASKPQP